VELKDRQGGIIHYGFVNPVETILDAQSQRTIHAAAALFPESLICLLVGLLHGSASLDYFRVWSNTPGDDSKAMTCNLGFYLEMYQA
jgi:hypothetical protein